MVPGRNCNIQRKNPPGEKNIVSKFLDQINRGGLIQPSARSCYLFCLLAGKLRNSIFECKEAISFFLGNLQRNVFFQALSAIFKSKNDLTSSCNAIAQPFMETSCYNCNCMIYVIVSELNDILHMSQKRQGQSEPGDRKIVAITGHKII